MNGENCCQEIGIGKLTIRKNSQWEYPETPY